MNRNLNNLLVLGVAGSLGMGVFNARADLEVGASVSITATADFHAPLSECGSWVEVGTYGRCWRPAGIAVSWRPYCDGHWEWTDCGWYWVSDEPWAWACYHYGNWVYDSGHGWIWMPGVEWGPAWVSWRVGGGYIGWAPLAPRHVSVVSAHFVFVQGGRFCDRVRPSTVIVNNTTVINQTTVINNGVRRENRTIGGSAQKTVVVNEGPGVAVVEKASGRKLKATPVQEVDRQTVVPAQVTRGKGKLADQQGSTPPKTTVEPTPKAKETPGLAPGQESPRKPSVPDTDKRVQPGKERDTGKPVAPVPDSPRKPVVPDADKRTQPGKERDTGKPVAPVPESPRKPVVPDTDKRMQPGKERDTGKPFAPVPESPRKPVVPDTDKRMQPGKERDTGKPFAPVPERPAPTPGPERKQPGVDRQPGPGGVNPPPQQRPQGPPTGGSQPSEKGGDKGGDKGHGKQDKQGKD